MTNRIKRGTVLSLALAVLVTVFFSSLGHAALSQTEKKVNINTASVAELQTLPQIGPKIAQRIIDFREENGKFTKITDLLKVKGIGEKTFEQLKNLITVGESPNLN
jgi:comEA protein